MVEQRNHFSNKFDDFWELIEKLKNQSLIAKVMAKQAKVKVDQARVRAEQSKIRAN